MIKHAQAFRMQLELSRLARRHRCDVVSGSESIPLSAPVAGPLLLHGLASTVDVDHHRQQFAPRCFGLLNARPPLLWKHSADQVAGEIESLRYNEAGDVMVIARVDHPLAARAPAFSIAAAVEEFAIVDADTPDFRAVISKATISEVSLTDKPANSRALVTSRWPVPAHREFYTLARRGVDTAIAIVARLREINAASQPRPAPSAPLPQRGRSAGRGNDETAPGVPRRGSFRDLVMQMEQRHALLQP